MKNNKEPLLYYRSEEDIKKYKKVPVKYKLDWLEAQMEFFHKTMTKTAKEVRERLIRGDRCKVVGNR